MTIHDRFWSPHLEAHAAQTLKTCITQMEDSNNRILNLEKAAGIKQGNNTCSFFAWDNRAPGKMKVWMDFSEQ